MERPVCYDVTRLLTRILNATPNGIDRVDFALATHLLESTGAPTFAATATGFGARLMAGAAGAAAIRGIGAHWGETRTLEADAVFRHVRAFLSSETVTAGAAPVRRRRPLPAADPRAIAGWIGRHGLPVRQTPQTHLPPHTAYVNASQFPLWVASSFEWLESRPDVRAAFFIHDLLPIHLPEYFRAGERARHGKRLANFARFAAAGIVTTRTVAADIEAHLATLGRRDCPLFVAPTPIAAIFAEPRVVDPALGRHPYFVLCSTLEPRKNHLMILAVWRALAQRLGREAPKLVLVGTRGWHYDAILDLVARSPALQGSVIEAGGLSTPGLKRLIDNAQALLMPSFGEGYGLPVHEALTAGAPVVASDVPAFREIEAEGLELLSPLDGEAWLETIAKRTRTPRPDTATLPASRWGDYFTALDRFLEAL